MNIQSSGHERSSDLKDLIIAIIKENGPISFNDFIDLALYHPTHGFYMTTPEAVGPKGDFLTAPEVHPIFARTMALRAANIWERLGCPDDFRIIEFGAGSGSMAEEILDELKAGNPGLYQCLAYVIVEISPSLTKSQQKRLARFGAKLIWISSLDELGPIDQGLVLANEVLDAFPVHVISKKDGLIKEVFVDTDDGRFKEVLSEPGTSRVLDYLKDSNLDIVEGQKAEINLNAVEWLEEVSSRLGLGNIIIIDYGYLAEELYSLKRMSGTLVCYYQHRVCDDPFANIGRQDITTHIDFSALMRTAARTGLEVLCFCTQGNYLINNGILDLLKDYEHSTRDSVVARNAIKTLVMPEHMGDIFKVLELQSPL